MESSRLCQAKPGRSPTPDTQQEGEMEVWKRQGRREGAKAGAHGAASLPQSLYTPRGKDKKKTQTKQP